MPTPSPNAATTTRSLGLLGARGSVGRELIALLSRHAAIDLTHAWSQSLAGRAVKEYAPDAPDGLVYRSPDLAALGDAPPDVVVLALANGCAREAVAALEQSARPPGLIIDCSADHRFDPGWEYGLAETRRDRIRAATRIANPGCYATAMGLSLTPLRPFLRGAPHCFGVSGYSGAGSTPSDRNDVAMLTGGVLPYASLGHLHEQELAHTLDIPIRFAPAVAPFERGIVMTTLFELSEPTSFDRLDAIFRDTYCDEPLVGVVGAEMPRVQDIVGRPGAIIGGIQIDPNHPRRGAVICVLDNLLKGAASQALQSINLALGLPELEGITP